MKKHFTQFAAAALATALLLSGCGETQEGTVQEDNDEPEKLTVVATVFPAYDFARAVGGEEAEVTLLLPPGAESHSYEPLQPIFWRSSSATCSFTWGVSRTPGWRRFWSLWSPRARPCG